MIINIHQYQIALFIPSVPFMLQVIWIVFFQMIIGCMLATVIYYWILPTSELRPSESKQSGSKSSSHTTTSLQGFLVGFGFVIPATIFLPYYAIDSFDIRNMGCRLAWCSLPMSTDRGKKCR